MDNIDFIDMQFNNMAINNKFNSSSLDNIYGRTLDFNNNRAANDTTILSEINFNGRLASNADSVLRNYGRLAFERTATWGSNAYQSPVSFNIFTEQNNTSFTAANIAEFGWPHIKFGSDGTNYPVQTTIYGSGGYSWSPTLKLSSTENNNSYITFGNSTVESGMRINMPGGASTKTAVEFNRSGVSGSITVTNTSVAYNTTSDYRLKENVASLTGAVNRVNNLNPVRFNFMGDSNTVDGFLAHEAQSVVPEAVTGIHDAVDSNGDPEYQGIDQSKLVPLLVAAIKEQQTTIQSLQTRIEALENN
jgi:hypothetical protein